MQLVEQVPEMREPEGACPCRSSLKGWVRGREPAQLKGSKQYKMLFSPLRDTRAAFAAGAPKVLIDLLALPCDALSQKRGELRTEYSPETGRRNLSFF